MTITLEKAEKILNYHGHCIDKDSRGHTDRNHFFDKNITRIVTLHSSSDLFSKTSLIFYKNNTVRLTDSVQWTYEDVITNTIAWSQFTFNFLNLRNTQIKIIDLLSNTGVVITKHEYDHIRPNIIPVPNQAPYLSFYLNGLSTRTKITEIPSTTINCKNCNKHNDVITTGYCCLFPEIPIINFEVFKIEEHTSD